jgi:2-polyprenyl-3-methyl-5-hydroxy-6-metoxy-1,4-benzoquinol methylase
MTNPWLRIPLEDYEAHMSLPSIRQAQMLADQFEQLLVRHRPTSVAIVGCAGGNGLERIEAGQVERVVGIDINAEYIEAARARHAGRLACLELHAADVQSKSLRFEPVELIYAALLFEYVDVPSALATLRRNCAPRGLLATVLQLFGADQVAVSPSPYGSLGLLAPALRLVTPAELSRHAGTTGFALEDSKTITLSSGKRFELQSFRPIDAPPGAR